MLTQRNLQDDYEVFQVEKHQMNGDVCVAHMREEVLTGTEVVMIYFESKEQQICI